MPVQPANATYQRRLQILEAIKRLSRSGQWVTQQELVKDLRGQGHEVQKHHVLRDLKALSPIYPQLECNAEFDESGNPKRGLAFGYRWVGRDAPPETGLSIPEALSLVLVARHLKNALPSTLTRSLDSLFDRAEKTLDLQKRNAEARWKDLIQVVPPTQPLLPPQISNDVLNVVHEALLAGERIEVSYRNAKGKQEKLQLHPLGLMLREPSSYLIALCNNYDDPRPFPLHRMQTATRTYEPSRKPADFTIAKYAVEQGHFDGDRMVTLRARVNRNLGMILGETPLELKQELGAERNDGWRTVSARVRDTWQLRWWILSEGDRMVIDSPPAIREFIATTAAKLVGFYAAKTTADLPAK